MKPRLLGAFFLAGTPAPQGSKRYVGKGRMIESAQGLRRWRRDATLQALALMDVRGHAGPVHLSLEFVMTRRKKDGPDGEPTGCHVEIWEDGAAGAKTTAPDLDKLVRATADALADAQCFVSDAQVSSLIARKRYAKRLT